ncbi:MAG: ABC transporter ATP-binding protein [Armatimonadota bacterium]
MTVAEAASPLSSAKNTLLSATDLEVRFQVGNGLSIMPVAGVSLEVKPGQTLGLVGESGCGKSTLGRALLQLVQPSAGSVRFMDQELTALRGEALRSMRRHMQIVFQDPRGSLDPRMTVRDIVEEPLKVHRLGGPLERARAVREMLAQVGLDATYDRQRPSQLSGGQQQRVAIARALITRPKFIVCDEPVSALDVSVQIQVLNLLEDLRDRFAIAYLFITHNLPVARHISDRIAVMYLGQIVEDAPADEALARPLHPYTRGLVVSALGTEREARARLHTAQRMVTGDVPSLVQPPSGCRFHPRCPHAQDRCRVETPALEPAGPGRRVACHFWREIDERPKVVSNRP